MRDSNIDRHFFFFFFDSRLISRCRANCSRRYLNSATRKKPGKDQDKNNESAPRCTSKAPGETVETANHSRISTLSESAWPDDVGGTVLLPKLCAGLVRSSARSNRRHQSSCTKLLARSSRRNGKLTNEREKSEFHMKVSNVR